MKIESLENKIIRQLKEAIELLNSANKNTYDFENIARMEISKAKGILETIKIFLE